MTWLSLQYGYIKAMIVFMVGFINLHDMLPNNG